MKKQKNEFQNELDMYCFDGQKSLKNKACKKKTTVESQLSGIDGPKSFQMFENSGCLNHHE